MLKRILLGALCACLLAAALPAAAFNGARKGFLLGGGLGLSVVSSSIDSGGPKVDGTDAGLGTDFRIGGGLSDQLWLYYDNRVSWFEADSGGTAFVVGGVGATYFFRTEAPAWYVVGALPISRWMPLEGVAPDLNGFGLSLGGGYEFARHWSVEAALSFGFPSDSGTDITVSSFMITFVGMAY